MRHCDSKLHVSGRSKYVDDLPALMDATWCNFWFTSSARKIAR